MTSLHKTASPTLYDQWNSFCHHPPDQIVYQEQTLFVGSDCKTVIRCPTDYLVNLVNLVVCGHVILEPDSTSPSSEYHITNIYVLGGKLECRGVIVVANRIIQLTRPQFEGALSALLGQRSVFKPMGPRKKETPPSRFKT